MRLVNNQGAVPAYEEHFLDAKPAESRLHRTCDAENRSGREEGEEGGILKGEERRRGLDCEAQARWLECCGALSGPLSVGVRVCSLDAQVHERNRFAVVDRSQGHDETQLRPRIERRS